MARRLPTAILLLVGCVVYSGAAPIPLIPSDTEIRQLLIERIDEEARGVGIVVGVVESGTRRVVAYGRLSADSESRPDGDSVFEIGSITKVFTSTVLASFVVQGALAFETPVQQLLGSEARVPTRNGAGITLLDLATHSSGLPVCLTTLTQVIRRTPTRTTPWTNSMPFCRHTS